MSEAKSLSLISIQYELILSLDQSQELCPMLLGFMRSCIKRVGFTSAQFYKWELAADSPGFPTSRHSCDVAPALSIPKRDKSLTGTETLLRRVQSESINDPINSLVKFQSEQKYYYAFVIPEVGTVVFGKKWAELEPELLNVLEQISPRLIRSCKSCTEREQLRREIRKRKKAEVELQASKHQAELDSMTDDLTKLPNRRALSYFLQGLRREASNDHRRLGILQIDLDNFKRLNDRHGHAAGDMALQRVARVLRSAVRSSDFVARLGGDEFVAVVLNTSSRADLEGLADRIISKIKHLDSQHEYGCQFGASIGISFATQCEHRDLIHFTSDADEALYEAKRAGRNRSYFFDHKLREQKIKRITATTEIREALDRGDFVPYFQPQVCARSGTLIGIEALVRWEHPTRGSIQPNNFLPQAEEVGLLDAIDRQVLEHSLAVMVRLDMLGLGVPKVGINITSSKLSDQYWLGNVQSALNASQLKPERIAFEIVESVIFDDNGVNLAASVAEIASAGYQIELDDFGTGHASLSTLRLLPLNCVKIDKTFVRNIQFDQDLRRLTGGIIGLIHGSGMTALAEGVENEREAEVLLDLGVDYLQGFSIAGPMPEAELCNFLRAEWHAQSKIVKLAI